MDSTRRATIDPIENIAEQLHGALTSTDAELARALVWEIDDGEAEQLFEILSTEEVENLLQLIGNERFADLLVRLEDQQAADVLEQFPVDQAADILEEIDPDDAADIFSEIDATVSDNILVAMEPDEAEEIRELLAWPPDTAGGIMTPAFVAIAPTLRADQAIAALRVVAEEAETINYVYVTDPEDHLLGVLSLHKLVLTRPHTPVSELMFTRPITVQAAADQEEAARTLIDNNLLAIPVIDSDQHILGIITVDDVAEVLEREATEDIERLGGSAPLTEPYLLASPTHLFRKRVVWLFLLFLAQFVTVSVISHYDSLLTRYTVLSFFIPILIGTGGNIGSQTVTTLIRAIGVGEVGPRHAALVFWKEFRTGIMLGLVMSLLMFGTSIAGWQQYHRHRYHGRQRGVRDRGLGRVGRLPPSACSRPPEDRSGRRFGALDQQSGRCHWTDHLLFVRHRVAGAHLIPAGSSPRVTVRSSRDPRSHLDRVYLRGGSIVLQAARDSVAAVFPEDQTAHVLSMVHRLGHGHHSRLIRESGIQLASRLQRCGLSESFRESALHRTGIVVLIVDAPHQGIAVSELLLGLGALSVERFQAQSVSSAVLAFDIAKLGERRTRRRSSRESAR